MRITEERLKSLRTSHISRLFFSLFGVGYDSKAEKLFSFVLVVGSLLLAIASLYTTIKGLGEYIPLVFAFFVGVGLQSLLVTTSWRIGATLYTKKIKLSLLIIYISTFITSVFFSYSALLDNIYDKSHRKADELERSVTTGTKITNNLVNVLRENNRSAGDSIIVLLNSWNKIASDFIDFKFAPLKNDFNQKNSVYQSHLDKVFREIHKGITPSGQLNGQIIYSDTGRGNNAIGYENVAQSYYYSNLAEIEKKVKDIDTLKEQFNNAYKDLATSSVHLTLENYSNYSIAYNNILLELSDELKSDTTIPKFPDSLVRKISVIDKPNGFVLWYEREFKLLKCKDIEEVKQLLLLFINKYPVNLSTSTEEEALAKIKSLGKYGGDNVHPFVLAMGEFSNGNPLAFASFIFALIIDGLLLFCGIIGSKPDSFLKMRTIEDLEDVQQYALEIILSLDLNRIETYENSYIKRIGEILKATKPNLNTAIEGYPAIINLEEAEKLFLTKEISVFIAFKLARRLKDKSGLALSTRLILWLTEQVINFEVENGKGDFLTT